MDFDLIFN